MTKFSRRMMKARTIRARREDKTESAAGAAEHFQSVRFATKEEALDENGRLRRGYRYQKGGRIIRLV